MMFYSFFNSGVFLILSGILLKSIAKKSYKILVPILIAISYLISYIYVNKWNSHEYRQFLLFDERTSLILTSIFLLVLSASTAIIFCFKNKSLHYIPFLFIYVGATISILFTRNLLCSLFFLEIMMIIATLTIFIQNDILSHIEGLKYFKFHILGGTFLLAGITSYYFNYNTFDIGFLGQNNIHNFSTSLILAGLLVNLAVPPFSSWLLGAYAVVPSYVSLIFAICTTKISALLIMKLFIGWNILIFIGIITSIYGILFSIFDNNIKRAVLYIIIAELGILLIFIGADKNNINIASIAIINDMLCIPIILCAANFVIHFCKQEEITKLKNTFNKTKLVLILTSVALLSIAAFPFTLGYISKKNLYNSDYLVNNHWLSYIIDLISIGITMSLCFRFTVYVFFKDFSFKYITNNTNTKLNPKEYYSYISALSILSIGLLASTAYFILISEKKHIFIDSFFLNQIQHILISGIVFLLLKRYLTYSRNIISLDPNILYLVMAKKAHKKFIAQIKRIYMLILDKSNDKLATIHTYVLSWHLNRNTIVKKIGWTIILAVALFLIILYPQK